MRLCRFFVLFGDVYCPDAIVDNTDSLYPPAIDLFGFEDQNFLHEFPDDLCVQFLNVRVLAYQRKEIICVDGFLPCIGQKLFQLGGPFGQLSLLRLVCSRHFRKPLIADLALHAVFVNSLNQGIQFGNPSLGLVILTAAVPDLLFESLFRTLGNQLYELRLVVPGIIRDSL